MDEIRQKLTFDVAQAVKDLTTFQNKLDEVNVRLANFASTVSGNRGLKSVAADMKSIGNATEKASKKLSTSVKKATSQVNQLTTSVKLLSRIVFTQLVVRSLTSLRLSLEQSIGQFIEFERAVAELGTISSSFASFEELSKVTRELSDNFNIDLIDATRGAYQAVSNQVIKSTADFEALNDIALFSKATNSSLADSIDLVTGALNAYGKDASQANELTAEFFKTIELGRVRANELNTAFGRAAPLASQLGISTAEINAALATLTIGGVKSSEAATQLRGAFTALIKPSEAMKEAFDKIGVATAEELIQLRGFGRALQAVLGTTDGTSQQIGQLFQRVRGLSGVLRLAQEDSKVFNANLEQIQNVSADLASEKGLGVLAKRGQQVDKLFNQLSNTLVTEYGAALTDIFSTIIRASGGVDNAVGGLTRGINLLGGALAGGVTAFAAYNIATKIAAASTADLTIQAQRAGAAARSAFGIVAALSAAFVAGDLIGERIAKSQNAGLNNLLKSTTESVKAIKQATDDNIREFEKQKSEAIKLAGEQVIELRKLYREDTKNIRREAEEKARVLGQALDIVLDAQRDRVRELQRIASDASTQFSGSLDRSRELGQSISDIRFADSLRDLTDTEKFTAQLERSTKVANEASQALRGARGQGEIDNALGEFARAEAAAEEARRVAETLEDRRAERGAVEQLVRIKQNQLRIEQSLRQEQDKRRRQAIEAAAVERNRLRVLKAAALRINDLSTPFDDEGNRLRGDTLNERRRELASQLKVFRSEIQRADNLNLDQILSVAQLGKSLRDDLTKNQLDTLTFAPSIFDRFAQQLEQKELKLNVAIANQQELTKSFDDLIQSARDDSGVEIARQRSAAQATAIQEIARRANSELSAFNLGALFGGRDTEAIASARAITGEVTRQALAGEATLQSLQQQRIELGKILEASGIGSGAAGTALNTLFSLAEGLVANRELLAEASRVQNASEKLTTAELKVQTELLTRQVALRRQVAGGGSGQVGRQMGGLLYRALGGAARGTDSIPAMLSPGEFVVNARSSRRFFSQLQSINSGVQPLFRQQGGSVTHVTIGDVNVTGGNNSRQTGRQIAAELRREMRRGTARSL